MGIYRGEKNKTGQRDEIGDKVTRKRDVNDSNDVMDVSFAMPQTVARREGFLAAQTQHMLQGTQACNVPLPDCEHVNQHSLACQLWVMGWLENCAVMLRKPML